MKRFNTALFSIMFGITAISMPIYNVSAATVQAPITRSQAEQRALNMINTTWTYSKDKNGNIASTDANIVTQPNQYSNLTTAQVTGIPYDWGGQDGLDSNSINTPWTSFLDAITRGAFAGNVNTTAGYSYVAGTAGIDCSGFIQATFNIHDYKISTSTMFDKYFTKINLTDLKHMDILDRPGDHVVIFDKWGTLNGVNGAYTYESTWDQYFGGIQGTKQYFVTMDDINNGYIPGRYVNIVDDSQNSTPTPVSNPTPPAASTPTPNRSSVTAGIFAQITNVNNAANFRVSPSTTSAIVSTIPKGTILYLITSSNGWYQVNYNGQVGWVLGNLVTSIPSGKYVTINNVYQLNIRSNPSTSSSIVGILAQNRYAQVLDYSKDGNWIKISINGIQGFAYSKYLRYIY
jgi:Bacterial SH3 domain.